MTEGSAAAVEDEEEHNIMTENTNNCICKELDDNSFMVICDLCNIWFHGRCVGVDQVSSKDILEYHCPRCEKKSGPSILVDRRKSGRVKEQINYADVNNGLVSASSSSSAMRNVKLKAVESRTSIDAPWLRFTGDEMNLQTLSLYGLKDPIIIDHPEGLDMKMPKSSITVMEIAEIVGDRPIEVMDVSSQESLPDWTLVKWARYFTNVQQRKRILNVISFEITDTPLGKEIIRPRFVRELDWISRFWPAEEAKEFPKVQLYCLMSPGDCWTDFHIDFGGTSVFYHLLSGKKVFFMIPPTDKNLQAYEQWCKSPEQSQIFFSDLVKVCYRVELIPGNTMFIPSGWIHAVYTAKDSIVIGGNFLHDFSVDMQCRIYELEHRCDVPPMYRFPLYEKLCWFTAIQKFDELLAEKFQGNVMFQVEGLQTLCDFLYKRIMRIDKMKSANKAAAALAAAGGNTVPVNQKDVDEKKLIVNSIPKELSSVAKARKFLQKASQLLTDWKVKNYPVVSGVNNSVEGQLSSAGGEDFMGGGDSESAIAVNNLNTIEASAVAGFAKRMKC